MGMGRSGYTSIAFYTSIVFLSRTVQRHSLFKKYIDNKSG
jgi:hypothetical protein